jgi:hypothetical protein
MSAKRFWAFSGMPVFESSLGQLIRFAYSRISSSVCLESWNVKGSMYCRSITIRLQPLFSWRSIGGSDRQWSGRIFGEPFKKLGLDLTPVRSRIAFDLAKKNCEALRDSRKYVHSTSPWRNYRQDDKTRNLDGVID